MTSSFRPAIFQVEQGSNIQSTRLGTKPGFATFINTHISSKKDRNSAGSHGKENSGDQKRLPIWKQGWFPRQSEGSHGRENAAVVRLQNFRYIILRINNKFWFPSRSILLKCHSISPIPTSQALFRVTATTRGQESEKAEIVYLIGSTRGTMSTETC